MNFPKKEIVDRVKKEYPAGTRVILQHMDDPQAPPVGTMGTVTAVDDTGSLCVRWDNGSGLNVVYGEDYARKMIMTDKVFRQLLAVRDSGVCNMLSINEVQRYAFDNEYFELVNYTVEFKRQYIHFIMHGTEE